MPLSPEVKLKLLQQYDPEGAVKYQDQQKKIGAYNNIKAQDPNWINTNEAYQDSVTMGYRPTKAKGVAGYADQLKELEKQNRLNREQSKAKSWEKIINNQGTGLDSSNVGIPRQSKSPAKAPTKTAQEIDDEIRALQTQNNGYSKVPMIDDNTAQQYEAWVDQTGNTITDDEQIRALEQNQMLIDALSKERDSALVKERLSKPAKTATKKFVLD
jgi:hypothetical protein